MNRTIKQFQKESGVSVVELVIVLLVIAILIVMAIPQIVASRRLAQFNGMQKIVVTTLREARQLAMSERTAITFRYDHPARRAIIFGGSLGAAGASTNRVEPLDGQGLQASEIAYGKPAGAPNSTLGDGTNLTALNAAQTVDIVFQADGAVINASENPINTGLFFYDTFSPAGTAFAVSILGAGGRVKLWRYDQSTSNYAE